jgi:hypothetical protein
MDAVRHHYADVQVRIRSPCLGPMQYESVVTLARLVLNW